MLCSKQFIELLCKSVNWFLHDRDLRHEKIQLQMIALFFFLEDTIDDEAFRRFHYS